MSDPRPPSRSSRRHPWPRFLVRVRRVGFETMQILGFFGAALTAVGRFVTGRWPQAPVCDEDSEGRPPESPGKTPAKSPSLR